MSKPESPFTPTERDWPEDAAHENGDYLNACCACGEVFTGHKRRPVCRMCSTAKPTNPIPLTAPESLALARDGRATVRMPVEPEPHPSCSEDGIGLHWHPNDDASHYVWAASEKSLCAGMLDYAPLGKPGDEVFVDAPPDRMSDGPVAVWVPCRIANVAVERQGDVWEWVYQIEVAR